MHGGEVEFFPNSMNVQAVGDMCGEEARHVLHEAVRHLQVLPILALPVGSGKGGMRVGCVRGLCDPIGQLWVKSRAGAPRKAGV